MAIYRIVTEAVTNVIRHARAARCTVTVSCHGPTVCVSVVDDGRGEGPHADPGHGLDTMRERAEELGGRFEICYDQGTTVRAEIPAGKE